MESYPPYSLVIIRKALKKPRLIKFQPSNLFFVGITREKHMVFYQGQGFHGTFAKVLSEKKLRH